MSAFVGPGQLLAFKKETLLANHVDNFWYGLDVVLKQSAFSLRDRARDIFLLTSVYCGKLGPCQ